MLKNLSVRNNHLMICLGIFFTALFVLHYNVTIPNHYYFDETHYVPAAKAAFDRVHIVNAEHPPLGKELIALGMFLQGDTPAGWRLMSVVFGALTLVGLYLWALKLFSNRNAALWVVLISFVDQGIYIQSRIGMLCIFLLAFLVWALAFFSWTWTSTTYTRRLFAATGLCLGLACACKWLGLAAWAMVVGIVFGIKIFQHWGMTFENPRADDWYRRDLWQSMRSRDWCLTLGLIPAAAYFITFVPEYGLHFVAILQRQHEMLSMLTASMAPHTYMSRWPTWPLMVRPVWYLWEPRTRSNYVTAIVYLSNPIITWCGLLAILECLWGWIVQRRKNAFIIFASWFSLYIFWAFTAREVSFTYYYLPSLSILSLALAYVFYETRLAAYSWIRRVFAAVSVALFVYFLPIISSVVGVSEPHFSHLMWFKIWR